MLFREFEDSDNLLKVSAIDLLVGSDLHPDLRLLCPPFARLLWIGFGAAYPDRSRRLMPCVTHVRLKAKIAATQYFHMYT